MTPEQAVARIRELTRKPATKPCDPELYVVEPTEIMAESGQVVCVMKSPNGRIIGVCTMPVEDVVRSRENAA